MPDVRTHETSFAGSLTTKRKTNDRFLFGDHMLTAQQHAERKAWIGASESADLCGLGFNGENGPYNVWLSKTGRVDSWDGNAATKLGDALEDAVVNLGHDAIAQQFGVLQSVRAPESLVVGRMGASLDLRLTLATPEETAMDGKTSGLTGPLRYDDWGESWSNDVPEKYVIQLNHQMHCMGPHVRRAFLSALLGGRGHVMYCIPRDQDVIDALQETVESFWTKHVQADTPPEGTPSMEVAKRIRRVGGMSKQIDTSIVLTWQRANDERKAAEKAEEAAKLAVIAALGQGDSGVCDAGIVTFYETERKGYTVQPTKFRSLKLKGKK